ncbi:MAG: restriction endonuclease [Candidatus Poribacteria bacterium]|nr:restriction endonuclease [Candidatus Poribacteria bacterium]
MKIALSVSELQTEAQRFAESESRHNEPTLFGVTDGKAVGTYLEHKFQNYLHSKYDYIEGSTARGIDLPELEVDIKTTSIKQPQSSCPFKSAKQKIYGLGYSLLVFVYEKSDDEQTRTGNLNIRHVIFIEESRTADFQTTTGLRRILDNSPNIDDIIAFLTERFLPVDDIQAQELAEEILRNPPEIGYLTVSNALQWRLQYTRVIDKAGQISGVIKIV